MTQKLKDKLERYRANHEVVSNALRKGKEQVAELEKMQAQLEALVTEFSNLLQEEENESSASLESQESGGQATPDGSVDVAKELSAVVS